MKSEYLSTDFCLDSSVCSDCWKVSDDWKVSGHWEFSEHKNAKGDGLATFDYIVSNPPFNMDFSDSRDTLAGDNHKKRFFAGVPTIPKKAI